MSYFKALVIVILLITGYQSSFGQAINEEFENFSDKQCGIVYVKIIRVVKFFGEPLLIGEADGIPIFLFPWEDNENDRKKKLKELLSLKTGKIYPLMLRLMRRNPITFKGYDELSKENIELTASPCSVKIIE